jgi:hypothetical protein
MFRNRCCKIIKFCFNINVLKVFSYTMCKYDIYCVFSVLFSASSREGRCVGIFYFVVLVIVIMCVPSSQRMYSPPQILHRL